jgi:hypothetical protein
VQVKEGEIIYSTVFPQQIIPTISNRHQIIIAFLGGLIKLKTALDFRDRLFGTNDTAISASKFALGMVTHENTVDLDTLIAIHTSGLNYSPPPLICALRMYDLADGLANLLKKNNASKIKSLATSLYLP